MKYDYVWQKFFQAIESLVGARSLNERIEFAAQSLTLLELHELPEEIKEDFKDLMSLLRSVESEGDEGRFHATAMAFSDEDAENIARKILSMYDKVARHQKPRS